MAVLQVGQRLGPYELIAELGRGGMATVFKARQASLDRFVALKVLSSELASDPSFVARFQREATIAARLDHPHIVPIYDVGEIDGSFYIAMRFVPGRSLAEAIRQEGPFTVERARTILAQVASALDHAHQHGVVHRDLKPGNILLESGDRASLADFGIARAGDTAQVTRHGTLIGTPKYMAPEQTLGQEVDQRADLYALGVIAHEMLAGKPPFDADSVATLLHQHAYTPPPSLRETRPDLPIEVDAAVRRMLAKQPEERYPSGTAFVAALAGSDVGNSADHQETMVAVGQPAARPSPPAPFWMRNLPTIGLVAAVILVVAAAALILRPGASPSTELDLPPAATDAAGSWWVFGAPGSAAGQFQLPSGIALDGEGNLYVADTGNHRIQKLSPRGEPIAQFGTQGDGAGELASPTDVLVDAQRNVYIADSNNHRVQKLSATGEPMAQWGTRGGALGQYLNVSGVAIDGQGNLYISDLNNHRIQQLSARGQTLTAWGSEGSEPGQFQWPFGLTVDAAGVVYVADQGNNRIQRFDAAGQPLGVIGSTGAAPGEFLNPTDVAVDGDGNLYVADMGNNRVQKLTSDGQVLAVWGSEGNGPGQFREPIAVAVDAQGNVYVVERGNHRVQRLDPAQ